MRAFTGINFDNAKCCREVSGGCVQRLKTRPQFQAVLAGGVVSRSPHFALHRLGLPQLSVANTGNSHARADSPSRIHAASESALPSSVSAPAPLFSPSSEPWLGAMVPKRWARRAVTRNAIKRQVYTVCGGLTSRFGTDVAYVVRLRSTFDRTKFVSASSDVLKHAVRLELLQLIARVLQPDASSASTLPKPSRTVPPNHAK
jgi:ribonuclease P protein component